MTHRAISAWLVVVAACDFNPNAPGAGPSSGDAGRDAGSDGADAPHLDAFDDKCFGSADFYFCLPQVPTGIVPLGGVAIDTGLCVTKTMIGTTQVCLVAGDQVAINSNLGVSGSLPLVIVAVTDLVLADGVVLDASSVVGDPGPNANPSDCNNAGIDGVAGAGGGGAGGSFGTQGKLGGNGATMASTGGTPAAAATSPVVKLRGGCAGGNGATGTITVPGGAGGGAVYLVSRGTLRIDGTIDASGAGGPGGSASKGGAGGGGAGGMIVLSGGTLSVGANATILANGGGGGGGAGNVTDGTFGSSPDATRPSMPAAGGLAIGSGTCAGGAGAAGVTAATAGPSSGNGGGGGGGGLGVIRVLAGGTIPAAVVSPPPS